MDEVEADGTPPSRERWIQTFHKRKGQTLGSKDKSYVQIFIYKSCIDTKSKHETQLQSKQVKQTIIN